MSAERRFSNVAAHLPAMAETYPHRRAVVFPSGRDRVGRVAYTQLTFRQLNELSDRYAHGLADAGIKAGTRTVLMVKPSLEFFALTFALFKVGAVIVMVDPGMGISNLGKCLAEAEPEAFIGIPKAHLARILFGWARKSVKINVTVGRRLFWGGYSASDWNSLPWKPYPMHDPSPGEMAAILFTSGSTGVPKGAVYTHDIFCSQVEMLRDEFHIEPGEIDLPTFPLFALFDPALGMTAIIPEMDASRPAEADPRKIIEAIEDHGVTNTFASPALLDRLGRYGQRNGVKLQSLRRVFSAGAPVAPAVLERFAGMLEPDARIYTPYGATEALPVAAIEAREIQNETRAITEQGGGICVGRPVPPMIVHIIKITDDPINGQIEGHLAPAGEIGEIVVSGPVVTRSYYKRPDLTALAKIAGGSVDAFFHRMGDLGRFDDKGRLWFCGRKNHRVTMTDRTLFTIPCEAIFNRHPKVFRTALVGVGPGGKQRPVLCVELEKANMIREVIREELLALGAGEEHTRTIQTILFHDQFPVDVRHNAKIGREQLAVWAAEQLGRQG